MARRQLREELSAALAVDLARVEPDSNLMQRLEVAVARVETRPNRKPTLLTLLSEVRAAMRGEHPEKTWQQRMPTWSAIPAACF